MGGGPACGPGLSSLVGAQALHPKLLGSHGLPATVCIGWGDLDLDKTACPVVLWPQSCGPRIGDGTLVDEPANDVDDAVALGVFGLRPGNHASRCFLDHHELHLGRCVVGLPCRLLRGFAPEQQERAES